MSIYAYLLVASIVLSGFCACTSRDEFTGPRIVIIGLDGADWEMIRELTRRGELPHLAGLIQRGSSGVLHTVEPMLSPMLWTSIVTGKSPPDHGVLDFFTTDEFAQRIPVPSRARRAKALWNIASDHNYRVGFVGWQVSHPAERVDGYVVSDRISGVMRSGESAPTGLTFPVDLLEELWPLVVSTEEVSVRLLDRFFPGIARKDIPSIETMQMILKQTEIIRRSALTLLDKDVDVLGVYFQGIDEVSHLFARYMKPPLPGIRESERRRFGKIVEEFYKYQDEVIGDLLSVLDRQATVYIVSDHGFRLAESRPFLEPSAKGTPYAPQWHRDNGVIVVDGPGIAAGGRLDRATIFDVTPTILAQLGIPAGQDMAGSALLDLWDSDHVPALPTSIPTHDRPGWRREVFAEGSGSEDESRAAEELAEHLKTLGYIGASDAAEGSMASAAEHANLAGYYMLQGQLASALREATLAAESDPGHYTAWRHQASIYGMMGQLDRAIPALLKAISLRPEAVEPQLHLADLYNKAGMTGRALSTARDLVESNPEDFRVHNKQGELLIGAGRSDLALAAFRRSLSLHPHQEEGHVGLFSVLLTLGNGQEIEKLLESESSTPSDGGVRWRALGKAHFRHRRFSEAITAFESSLERDPRQKEGHLYLGILYGELDRQEDSLREFDRALRIDAGYAEAHFNKGITLLRAGASLESIEPLSTAASLRPHSEPILTHLGKAYFMVGDRERAREAFERALLINPDSPMAHRYLAQIDTARPEVDGEPI
jgi:predicted AlkP superfamily phosphohydrolase/phosphomutase/tetratricopeptide (TPR) repeat protein